MQATVSMDAAEFNKLPTAFRAIAGAAGAAARDVLRGEAGVILKGCIALTSVSSIPKSEKRSNLRFLRGLELTGRNPGVPVTISAGVKRGSEFGRVHLRTSNGHWRRTHDAVFRPVGGQPNNKRKKAGDHYSKPEWLIVRSAIDAVRGGIVSAREAGRKSIGLARQSWIQIADTLGVRLEDVRGGSVFGKTVSAAAISRSRAAMPSNGRTYQNGLGTEQRTSYQTILTLLNRYPNGVKIGMDATLRSVLQSRIRFFERNLELGVFNSIAQTARAYPYLQILSHG